MRNHLQYAVGEIIEGEGVCVISEKCFEHFIVVWVSTKMRKRDKGRNVIAFRKYVRSCLKA